MATISKYKTTKKIWIISELFHPDDVSTAHIMTSIAVSFSEHYSVNAVCGPSGYDNKSSNYNNRIKGIRIYRSKCPNLDKNRLATRLLRQLWISIYMLYISIVKISKDDRVLVVTNPALIIPIFAFLTKAKRLQTILLVHDVFPENLLSAKVLKSGNSAIYKFLLYLYNKSYRSFKKIIVIGRDMEVIVKKKVNNLVPISVIENWADTDNVYPTNFLSNQIIINNNLQSKTVFLFAGNIGRQQGLIEFLEIISNVKNQSIHFLFAGNGVLLPTLKDIVKSKNLNNTTFLGSFPRSQQNLYLNACHFGVVTLADSVFGLGVPSKSYNILSAGKPILFIGNQDSEVSLMIKEFNLGFSFSFENKDKIISFFENISINPINYNDMCLGCREVAITHYSRASIQKKFSDVIMS